MLEETVKKRRDQSDLEEEIFLSVIIPAHNEEGYIGATLDSLLSQDNARNGYEIIVVCDDCQDDTRKIAESKGAKTIDVVERSPAASRNRGTEYARGNVFVFHDADTITSENYFREIERAVNQGHDFGCARLKEESRNPFGVLSRIILNYFSWSRKYFHGNCFVKKSVFLQSGGFNERLTAGADTDLSERLKKIARFKYLRRASLDHSERRFRERGYGREFLRKGIEGMRYLLARDNYYQKYEKPDLNK